MVEGLSSGDLEACDRVRPFFLIRVEVYGTSASIIALPTAKNRFRQRRETEHLNPKAMEKLGSVYFRTPHSLYQNTKNLILGAYLLDLATSWSVQQPYSLVMGDCPLIVKMTYDLVCVYNTNT